MDKRVDMEITKEELDEILEDLLTSGEIVVTGYNENGEAFICFKEICRRKRY